MKAKRWIVRGLDTESAASLARVLGVSPIRAAFLTSRCCDNEHTVRAFLSPSYDQLHDPYLMLGVEKTIAPLQEAISNDERVLIYNPGLRAFIEVAGCGDGKGMTAYDLGFRLGRRTNAAGRMMLREQCSQGSPLKRFSGTVLMKWSKRLSSGAASNWPTQLREMFGTMK
jgi:hypothetical protein